MGGSGAALTGNVCPPPPPPPGLAILPPLFALDEPEGCPGAEPGDVGPGTMDMGETTVPPPLVGEAIGVGVFPPPLPLPPPSPLPLPLPGVEIGAG